MSEKLEQGIDYVAMDDANLPWMVHMITEAPFNCHTHGLKELGSPVEVSMNAHDPALSVAVGHMLNDVARYVASTGAILEDGQVMKLGGISLHFHAGQCPSHLGDPTFIHLTGIERRCDACASEAPPAPSDRRDKLGRLLDTFTIGGIENYRGDRYVVLEHGIEQNDYQTMGTLHEVAAHIGTAIRRPFGFLAWYDLDDDDPHPHHSCSYRIDVEHEGYEASSAGKI